LPTEKSPVRGKGSRIVQTRILLVILGLSLCLRLIYSLALFTPLLHQKGEELGWVVNGRLAVDPYDSIARNIVAGKGYVDDTGRVNFERTPLYTFFLALIYRSWGSELWKLQVVQSILDTVTCFLLFYLARKVLKSGTAALLAAAFYAVYFKMIAEVARPETETLYILVLMAFLALFTSSLDKKILALPAGIGLGLLTLCKPITLLFPVVVIAIYFLRVGPSRLKKAALFLSGFLICVLPLFVRNDLLAGRLFFSTGGGKMLYMGTVIDYSRNFRNEEQRLIKDINAKYAFPYRVEDDNALRNLAVRNIVRDPWGYLRRVATRVYLFWTYPDYSTPMMALKSLLVLGFNLSLLLLAFWGALLARKKGLSVAPFLGIFLYIYLAYALIYAYSRYSLPLFPMIFMFSSYGIMRLWEMGKAKSRVKPA